MNLELIFLGVLGLFIGILTRRYESKIKDAEIKKVLGELLKRGCYVLIVLLLTNGFIFLLKKELLSRSIMIWCGVFYLLSCVLTLIGWKAEKSSNIFF